MRLLSLMICYRHQFFCKVITPAWHKVLPANIFLVLKELTVRQKFVYCIYKVVRKPVQ